MRAGWLCFASVLFSGCGAAASRSAPVGVSLGSMQEAPTVNATASKPPVPDDVVARAAQAFHGRRRADGLILDQASLVDELSHFDVVCLGEAHDDARDHFAEFAIVQGLHRRAQVSGRALGIGFEMFQAPFDAALGAYGRGRLSDAGLRSKTHYDERWGYPYAYYRPILSYGRRYGLPLKALNAPRELSHAIAENGLANLSPALRRQLPELDLDDVTHRAEFDRAMAGHPHGAGTDMDNFYAAQVVWDETMASNVATWLIEHAPSRQMVVLAGSAHCRREAIPARIERRTPVRAASVRLSAASPEDSDGFAYTLIFD